MALAHSARGSVAIEYRTCVGFLGPLDDVYVEQVTVVTQASMDRLPKLAAQALSMHSTPLSVAIYVPYSAVPLSTTTSEQDAQTLAKAHEQEALDEIGRFHHELAAKGARRVTISLLFANAPTEREYDNMYPINNLRNLALDAAKTRFVFLVDVDFVPCQLLGAICSAPTGSSADEVEARQAYSKCVEMCEQGAMLVVPAFELQFCVEEMPKTQADLMVLWKKQRAEGFHISNFPKGHAPTDFERWFEAEAPYGVEYQGRNSQQSALR